MFFGTFPEFLEYCNTLLGKAFIMGDFNIHFKTLNNHNSRKTHDISEYSVSVSQSIHKHGHLLDLVFHRHKECLLRSTCPDHGLRSDHIAALCQTDIPKPAVQPVTTQFRSIGKIDWNSFKQDLAQSITPLTPITDFNRQLRCVLDKNAPLCHRTVRQRKPTPWFSSIGSLRWENWKGNVAVQKGAGWNQNSQCTNRSMKTSKGKSRT